MGGRLFLSVGVTAVAVVAVSGASADDKIALGGRGALADVGGRLAFVVKRGKVESIAVRELAGGSVRLIGLPRFRSRPVDVESLAWSPNADRLAFSDLAGRVYVVGADGTGLRLVAATAERARRRVVVHDWSPDGSRLAVTSSRKSCPAAGEPWLLVVEISPRSSRRLPAHPVGAPAASRRDSAYIEKVHWAPDGSELLYAWEQYRGGGCRTMGGENRPTRVMRIGADGTGRVQVAARELIFNFAWAPSGRSIALTQCGEDEPLAWTTDEAHVVIATIFDGCTVWTVDRSGRKRAEAVLEPSRLYGGDHFGAVEYAVSTANGKQEVLWAHGQGVELQAIGTLPGGGGVVSRVFPGLSGRLLAIVPLVAAPPTRLPPLNPPNGMRVVGPVSAGLTH